MAKHNRTVRMDQFMSQVNEEMGLDEEDYLPVELKVDGQIVTAYLYLPVVDEDASDVLMRELEDAPTARDKALLLLGGRETVTAEEQLALFEAAGYRPRDVTTLFAVQGRRVQERLTKVGKARSSR